MKKSRALTKGECIPSYVDILGKQYRIVTKKMRKEFGTCDYSKSLIKINKDSDEEQMRDTILHECIHAIDQELDAGMKERQVRLLATGLLHWLRANPAILAALVEPRKHG